MTGQDIELRRKLDRERHRRLTAGRKARGLCVRCGKRPPGPGRARCEPCAAKVRPGDRARHRRKAAGRAALGLCPKCGRRPPAPGRSQCAPCQEMDNAAGRARDARLRAAGIPRRDTQKANAGKRERTRRVAGARRAEGLCAACGKAPAVPDRASCEPCLDKRRARNRAKYAAGKAAGKPYGGADPDTRRRAARARSRRRRKAWRAAGLCVRCGAHPAAEGGTTCTACRERRRATERRRYAGRRAAGRCVACNRPAPDGRSRCAVCATVEGERRDRAGKNAAARKKYAALRARSQCTGCGAPAFGTSRCPTCAKRSFERHVRGMPVYPASFAVHLRETGECLGVFDDEMEAAAWLAFEKLSADRVEVVRDASPLAAMAAWE